MRAQHITLLPLLGAWHMRYPAYNTESVLELARASAPEVLVLAPLPPAAFASPSWQETPEIALPLSVVPWARRRGLKLEEGMVPSPDPEAEADFRRYVAPFPETQSMLRSLDRQLEPLADLLNQPLTPGRIWQEVVPLVAEYQHEREEAFGDGPATDWWRKRITELAKRIANLPETEVTVLAAVEQLPFLIEAFAPNLPDMPQAAAPSEAVRERALLDAAFRGDAADPAALITQLRNVNSSEARFHEANLLLTHGHMAEALELLEGATAGDFSTPYYLPGYLLARLGQLRDLAGDREGALRAYRGVLAFDWVPVEAREAAQAGLRVPFEGLAEGSEEG